jgi:hypothetical protein
MLKKIKTPAILLAAIATGYLFSHIKWENRVAAEERTAKVEGEGVERAQVDALPPLSEMAPLSQVSPSGGTEGAPKVPESSSQTPSPTATPSNGSAPLLSPSPVEVEEADRTEGNMSKSAPNSEKSANKEDASTHRKNELDDEGRVEKETQKSRRRNLDEYGFEKVDSSGEDIVEMNARLLALEQAFSIDSRRSKGRGAGAINDSGEMDELRESLSNLYEIVQNLPSIDSLQVKIDAVDKAVEEMNSTIEMINAVAKKMETSEIDAALKASGDAAAAANEALTEAKKISEEQTGLSAKLKEVATASGVYEALLVQFEEEKKARLLLTEQLDKQKAGTDALAKQIADLGKDQSSELIPKIEAVNRNIAVIDKNVKVLSSSYKMVYDNALRVDDRLGRLEKDGDRVADRISLLEKNLLPPE